MLTDDLKRTIQSAYSTLLESKGLKARYGQRLMIAEVAKTLTSNPSSRESGEQSPICVVEAGTGTGKTIAYAVAAIPVAKALGKTLIISTATISLQEQIVYKDLPDILRHSDLEFSFALAKGRGRYLCLTKLDSVLQDNSGANQTAALYPDELPMQIDTQTLSVYQTMLSSLSTGDWDGDIDSWKQQLEPSVWSRVTTDHAQCTGRRCSNISQCAFFKAREEINKVDVIVTNHDLVLADLALGGGAILTDPDETIYIFDEGHHLPDKTINHFAQFSRVRSTERWLDQAGKAISKAQQPLSVAASVGGYLNAISLAIETLKQHLGLLFNSLQEVVDVGPDDKSNDIYHRFEFGVVPEALRLQATELAAQYRNIYDLLDNCCSVLEEAMESSEHGISRADAEAWFPPLSIIRGRAEANHSLWQDYSRADKQETPPRSRWITVVDGMGGNLDFEVSSSPILAANTLTSHLWHRCYAAVITSATLTALGSFDRFAMRSGTDATTQYAIVPSPFNYQQAGELVVPVMDCDPSDAFAHTDALITMLPRLLNEEEGSLVLFASRRQMEEVYDGIASDWQDRIIMQGQNPKHETIRMHKEALDAGEGSVIFGLASFAEGVDLPGKYCDHVVIAKIPFAVPDQPVESALAEWIEQRGGNPFMDIAVPDAALKLVQASGRLLRTETDSGRITLLDRRIVSRRYGKAILDSLPPFKRSVA